MRFALLGDHSDGLDMARALAESRRHELAVYSGPPHGAEYLARWGLQPRRVGDVEAVLADPRVEAVIVAGGAGGRPAQLRRAPPSGPHRPCRPPPPHSPGPAPQAAPI